MIDPSATLGTPRALPDTKPTSIGDLQVLHRVTQIVNKCPKGAWKKVRKERETLEVLAYPMLYLAFHGKHTLLQAVLLDSKPFNLENLVSAPGGYFPRIQEVPLDMGLSVAFEMGRGSTDPKVLKLARILNGEESKNKKKPCNLLKKKLKTQTKLCNLLAFASKQHGRIDQVSKRKLAVLASKGQITGVPQWMLACLECCSPFDLADKLLRLNVDVARDIRPALKVNRAALLDSRLLTCLWYVSDPNTFSFVDKLLWALKAVNGGMLEMVKVPTLGLPEAAQGQLQHVLHPSAITSDRAN